MFPIDAVVVQPEPELERVIACQKSDPDPMFSGQAQDLGRDLDDSILMELTLKCPEVEMSDKMSTEMDVAISIRTPDKSVDHYVGESVGRNVDEKNVVTFDIFDETTEEYDEDCSVFVNSIKKPTINYCRSISMPYARHVKLAESGSQQVSLK